MADVKLPFGRREGQYLHISQVDRGLRCNCRCPGCNAELIAKKRDTAHHFAHRAKSDCTYRPESALHDYSKRLISQQLSFRTPNLHVTVQSDSYHGFWGDDLILGREFAVKVGTFEKRHEDIVPDVQFETEAGLIFVEIAVTHFVDQDKRSKLRRIGIPTVEINLSSIAMDSPLEVINQAVLSDLSIRKWAYHPEESALRSHLRKKLQEKIAQYELENSRNTPDDSVEEDGREEDDDFDGWMLLKSAIDQYDGENIHEWLQSIPSNERTERYKSLSHLDKLTYHCFLLERRPETLPLLFNRQETGAPPFLCPSIVWRTGVFFRFVATNQMEFSVVDVVQWCRGRYEILNFGPEFGDFADLDNEVADFLLELEDEGYVNSDGFIPRHRRFRPAKKQLPNWSRFRN